MAGKTERNLGVDLARATEVAALAAGQWVGRGEKQAADAAATQAMRQALNTIHMDGQVVIGEEARHPDYPEVLTTGESIGDGKLPMVDIAVNPVEGISLLAEGLPEVLSVAAAAPKGAMHSFAPAAYMEKLVVSREVALALTPKCLDAPAGWTLGLIAREKRKPVSAVTVFVLDRPRHEALIADIRACGARILLRPEGDVAGALRAATPGSGVDALMGIGGTAEGVIGACATKALNGGMLARLAPQSDDERSEVLAAGLDVERIFECDQMITSDDVFFAATGITDGGLLDGVRFLRKGLTTHSLVLRGKTGTLRTVHADHHRDWLTAIMHDGEISVE
jgi:fructose-1,6-bisphosphatase II